MGAERWYLAPSGVVPAGDVPSNWGLAEVRRGRVHVVVPAPSSRLQRRGGPLLTYEHRSPDLRCDTSHRAEAAALVSALRRVKIARGLAPLLKSMRADGLDSEAMQALDGVNGAS